MADKFVSFAAGVQRYRVELVAQFTGGGINLLLTGGENPHIGGVVMAAPRDSLTGQGISSDAWVIPVPGHKDHILLQELAEKISRLTCQTVVASGGINICQATAQELKLLQEHASQVGELLQQYCIEHGMAGQYTV